MGKNGKTGWSIQRETAREGVSCYSLGHLLVAEHHRSKGRWHTDRMAAHTNHMLQKLGTLELVPSQALQFLWQDVPDNSNDRREPPKKESLS